jgi:5-hydroxyisourate hydrolase-like protein (transthyretin family)
MISTQVIDTAIGRPAPNLPVVLDVFIVDRGWQEAGHSFTDDDGIIETFGETFGQSSGETSEENVNSGDTPPAGIYRLTYDVAAYRTDAFFPTIGVTFEITDPADDCHVAVHLSPFGYSVSRG